MRLPLGDVNPLPPLLAGVPPGWQHSRVVSGHFWTIGPWVAATLRPPAPPPARHFRTHVADAERGWVRITGRLHDPGGASTLALIVHGLGGSAESHYVVAAARAAASRGLASLRLHLRGADRSGEDYYHAGLTADLHAALASEELSRFDSIYLIGYSLGGHLSLRLATEPHDPRVRAVAAVCPPLDLALSAAAIDHTAPAFYRRHVLASLKEMYADVAARGRPVPTPAEEVRRIRTLRDWDDRVVAPRHGFEGAEDYWARASVGPRLGEVRVPALVLEAERDPMVRKETVQAALEGMSTVETMWLPRGGHVGFPADLDLGQPGPPGLEPQLVSWLLRDRA